MSRAGRTTWRRPSSATSPTRPARPASLPRRQKRRRAGPAAREPAPRPRGRAPGPAVLVQPRAGCWPTAAARRSRSCAIRCGSPSRSSARSVLMLAFGFGITTDVENIRFAALDLDQTPESRGLPRGVRGLPLLPPAASALQPEQMQQRLGRTTSRWRSRCPTEFGRELEAERRVRRSRRWSTEPTRSGPRPSSNMSPE